MMQPTTKDSDSISSSLSDRKEKVIEIFTYFSYIERMIEVVLEHNSISYRNDSFSAKSNKFLIYLDRRPNKTINTNEPCFNYKYSLEDVIAKIKKYRNIVAHETGFLLYDTIYDLPIHIPGVKLARGSHNGNIEDLYNDFIKYANMITDLYIMVGDIGGGAFDVFDINGRQIGEY